MTWTISFVFIEDGAVFPRAYTSLRRFLIFFFSSFRCFSFAISLFPSRESLRWSGFRRRGEVLGNPSECFFFFPLVACCISLLHILSSWSRQMGAGLVRFRIVVQWEDHRSRKPNICTLCWLVHVEEFVFSPCFINTAYRYLILASQSLSFRSLLRLLGWIPCSIY